MADVLKRVEAMSVTAELWPSEPSAGSGFAADGQSGSSVSTYTVTRIQLLEAIRRLKAAASLVRRQQDAEWGAHLVILRPALVLTAKAGWIVRPNASPERVARASGLVISDQRMGARAMWAAVDQGAVSAFESVGTAFEGSASLVESNAPQRPVAPLGDQALIRELASDVDEYCGTTSAAADMQILWNVASSLAHGERWFSLLAGGVGRARLADILTARSLDVVCSGINTTSLRLLWHAVSPPEAPEES